MTTSLPLADTARAYADWAHRIWQFHDRGLLTPQHAEELVLVLGLGGEASELLDELLGWTGGTSAAVPDNLVKELGDVMYNWVRVGQGLQLDVVGWLSTPPAPVTEPDEADRHASALRWGSHLVVAAGAVLEVYKKALRDGPLDRAKAEAGMRDFLGPWFQLCHLLALVPAEVLRRSQAKLNARLAAGTLCGSGNER